METEIGMMIALVVYIAVLTAKVGSHQAHKEYIGCFRKGIGESRKNDPLQGVVLSTNLTTSTCRKFCLEKEGIFYYGTSSGGRCYCWGSAANFRHYGILTNEACNEPCKGNITEICGGSDALSMFADSVGICNNVTIENGFAAFNGPALTVVCQRGFKLKGNPILPCDLELLFGLNLTLFSRLPTCKEQSIHKFSLGNGILLVTMVVLALSFAAGILIHYKKSGMNSQPISTYEIEQSYSENIVAVNVNHFLDHTVPTVSVTVEHDVANCANAKYENMHSPADSHTLPLNLSRHFWLEGTITTNSERSDFNESSSSSKNKTKRHSLSSLGESEIGADVYYIAPNPSETTVQERSSKNISTTLTFPLESRNSPKIRRSRTLKWTRSFKKPEFQNFLSPIYMKVNKKSKKGESKVVAVSPRVHEASEEYEKVGIENSKVTQSYAQNIFTNNHVQFT